MPAGETHPEVGAALRAARRVLGDEHLVEQLRSEELWPEALRSLRLSPAVEVRDALLEIVDKAQVASAESRAIAATDGREQRRDEVRSVLMRGYGQIQLSFWLSLVMSALLFLVGLGLLALAAGEALSSGELSAETVTVAGLGLADFVLVFYTRPSKDIATNLAATQRSQFLATTYLSGMSLIRDDDHALDHLIHLTERMVALTESPEEQAADGEATRPVGRREGPAGQAAGASNARSASASR